MTLVLYSIVIGIQSGSLNYFGRIKEKLTQDPGAGEPCTDTHYMSQNPVCLFNEILYVVVPLTLCRRIDLKNDLN